MADRGMDLMQGTLDLLVLKALEGGRQHGYGVAEWVRGQTDGELEVEEGALYTALHRMERRGWLTSEWGVSQRKRRAKYYTVTEKGGRQLAVAERTWRRYVGAVGKVLEARDTARA